VASAGSYANNLHLAPDNHATAPLSFTGRMPFLPPYQQRQSSEGSYFSIREKVPFTGGHNRSFKSFARLGCDVDRSLMPIMPCRQLPVIIQHLSMSLSSCFR